MHKSAAIQFGRLLLLLLLCLTGCDTTQPTKASVQTISVAHGTPTYTIFEQTDPNITPTGSPITESALAGIRARGEIRVGILYNYPPFGYLAPNGQVQGFDAEIIRNIAKKWGIQASFVQVTRQTRLPMLISGEVDMLAAMPHRRELEQFVEFTTSTFASGYTALVTNNSGIASLAQVGGGPVAVISHDSEAVYSQYSAQHNLAPIIQLVDTPEIAADLLTSSTVRAVIGRREALILVSTSAPESRVLTDFIITEPYAFAVRRGDYPLRDLFNLTLQQLASENTLAAVFSNNFFGYTPDPYPLLDGDASYDYANSSAKIDPKESALARFRRGEPLRVAGFALSTTPVPFDSQPVIDGFNRAVVNEVARRWNIPVAEIPNSVGTSGIGLLQSGQADLVVGIRPEKSMIGIVSLSQPYYLHGLRLAHMDDVTIAGIADLEAKPSLVIPPIDIGEDLIKKNNSYPKVEKTESYQDAFEALSSRAAYALVGDEFSLELMAQADNHVILDEKVYRRTGYVLAADRGDSDLLALINFTLQDMASDGTLQRLADEYLKPYVPAGQDVELPEMEFWPGDGTFLGIGP